MAPYLGECDCHCLRHKTDEIFPHRPRQNVTEHMDGYGFDVAIRTGQVVYPTVGMTNLDYAAAICRARNEWRLEHRVAKSLRFGMALAADEIWRLGDVDAPCTNRVI